MSLYPLGVFLFRVFFALFFRVRVEGLENVPRSGGLIVCANHFHMLDPPLLGVVLPRPVRFMAKEELFRNPLLGRLLLGVGAFPVRRGTADRRALKQALRVIENGTALGLFPEGTRGSPGELQEAKGGAAFVALRTEAPVLPVAIHGPYQLFDEVVVSIGEPFRLKVEGGSSKIDAAGQQIMEGIRRLLEKR